MTSARHRRRARRQELASTRLADLRKLIWDIWHKRPLGSGCIPVSDYTRLTQFVEGGGLRPPASESEQRLPV